MKSPAPVPGPQGSRLFRLVGGLARMQLGYRLRNARDPRLVVLLFVCVAGATGLAWLMVLDRLFPASHLLDPSTLDGARVLAIALAMGTVSVGMMALRVNHPPAAATALIAVSGHVNEPVQMLGVLVAVLLLVMEAFVFIRILGGLSYPLWRSDPEVVRGFGALAGRSEGEGGWWDQLSAQLFRRR